MGVLSRILGLLRPSRAAPRRGGPLRGGGATRPAGVVPMRGGGAPAASVVEAALPAARDLRLTYAPSRDGRPSPGEIVWARVPYAEDPSQGKDRPLLVLALAGDERSWAMKLTSRSHDGERDHLPLGAGEWDREGRPSWLDVDQIYLVPAHGIRREAGALDRAAYLRVATALSKRYGWPVDD